jgi:hypothetical protein
MSALTEMTTRLLAMPLPWVDRTRRNHGLEHATITLLSQKYRGLSMAGRSTPFGFYLYGDVSTEALTAAAQEALRRLRAGEHQLALHPNCGTNFLVSGAVAAGIAFLTFLGARTWRDRLERLPFLITFATLGLIASQPLGITIQREVTTSGIMGRLTITRVERFPSGPVTTHFVKTGE